MDAVRGALGAWIELPHESGLAARRLAVAMVTTHLVNGHDVIVPQLLARDTFVLELEAAAKRTTTAVPSRSLSSWTTPRRSGRLVRAAPLYHPRPSRYRCRSITGRPARNNPTPIAFRGQAPSSEQIGSSALAEQRPDDEHDDQREA